MKLWYLAELIVEIAIGIMFIRIAYDALGYGDGEAANVDAVREYLGVFGPVFLSGIGAAGAIGLAVEAMRGRSPRPLGIGRWVWAIAGLYALVINLKSVLILYPLTIEALGLVERGREAWGSLGPLLIAFWIAARMARVPRAGSADAREWAGRVLAGAILLQSVIELASYRWPER